MNRIDRIARIMARIQAADTAIIHWLHVRKYTTRKPTRALAQRMVEKFEDRRDLWEERLVNVELS